MPKSTFTYPSIGPCPVCRWWRRARRVDDKAKRMASEQKQKRLYSSLGKPRLLHLSHRRSNHGDPEVVGEAAPQMEAGGGALFSSSQSPLSLLMAPPPSLWSLLPSPVKPAASPSTSSTAAPPTVGLCHLTSRSPLPSSLPRSCRCIQYRCTATATPQDRRDAISWTMPPPPRPTVLPRPLRRIMVGGGSFMFC